MESIKELYERLKVNDMLNTSYPLHVKDWEAFRVPGCLPFTQEDSLAFYIHIPFCRQLCSFCEYCRMPLPSHEKQKRYLTAIENDINHFLSEYKDFSLYGFDIGGGTPTSLDETCFDLLLNIYDRTVRRLPLAADFEPSIEATFQTLSVNKIRRIAESGIKRISLGVQTTDANLLQKNHRRPNQIKEMQYWIDVMHSLGIRKINLDLMYGLCGQNEKSVKEDIGILQSLHPEQITFYELRTNMIGGHALDKRQRYKLYSLLWEGVHNMGYIGRFGQNTFSLKDSDFGTSSYLRHRMIDGASYKGFGMSAQSMSQSGISYNLGKLSKHTSQCLENDSYMEEYTYNLPVRERLAKFISISAYSGSLSLKNMSNILGKDAQTIFEQQIQFVLQEGLFVKENDTLYITKQGFKHFGAAFAMFYHCLNSN